MRQYQQYPTNLTLKTTLGDWTFAITERNHIAIETKGTVRVYGTEFYASFHLGKYESGWELYRDERGGTSAAAYVRKTSNSEYASAGAVKRILSTLLPAVNKWAEQFPEFFEAAHNAHLNNEIGSRESLIAQHEAEIARLRREISALENLL